MDRPADLADVRQVAFKTRPGPLDWVTPVKVMDEGVQVIKDGRNHWFRWDRVRKVRK